MTSSTQSPLMRNLSVAKIGWIGRILRFDLAERISHLRDLQSGNARFVLGLIVTAAVIQLCAQFIPFLSWFTWPYLVFACVDILNTQKPSWRLAPQVLGKRIFALKGQLSVAFSLFLYGALGLLMFRVVAELIQRISLPVGVLPNEIVALLPYTLSEAIVFLFIGASSARYTVSLEDPLSILGKALMDLVLAPISFLILVILQTIVIAPLAIYISLALKMPVLSTFLGHAPFILIALFWSCGQIIKTLASERT
jgi:hypothetical protein